MRQKGITLIALVITIIVLIILAGVSIDLLLGDNGLINKSKETVKVTEMAKIKEEAEFVRLGLDMDYLSNRKNAEKLKKATLLSEINKYFEGSTKNGNRVTTSDEKYDIIVRNNLEILVIEHNKSYLKDGEIELDYYYDETVTTGSVWVEIYPEVGGIPTYEEYAQEILDSITETGEARDAILEQYFIESEKYWGHCSEEGMEVTDFVEYMQNDYGGYGFAEGEEPTTLEELRIWANENWKFTFETVEEMLISWKSIEPEECYEYIGVKIECSNGTIQYAYAGDYTGFGVTKNGTYTFTATGPNGETGEVTIEINNIKSYIIVMSASNTIEIGKTFNITAITNSSKNLIWTSSDETIATVEGSGDGKITGIITGKKSGTATITVTDGSIIKTCVVTVVEYAKYDEPYTVEGYTHFGTENWNSGYRISDTGDETGNIFVWVPCVTDQNKVRPGDTVVTFKKTTAGKYNTSLGISPTNTTVTDVEPTNAIKESVEKYGGFYIAAYEAGIEGEKNNSNLETATELTVKPLSKSGKYLWNGITRTDALTVAANMVNTTDGVKSGLISGECWDTTLQWMVNASSNKAANVGYDTNSAGKGWFSDVSGGNSLHTTGYYGVNNIYDMAGNVWEWTTENCTTITGWRHMVYRGSYYYYSGSDEPAAYRRNSSDMADGIVAFRVVLYQ